MTKVFGISQITAMTKEDAVLPVQQSCTPDSEGDLSEPFQVVRSQSPDSDNNIFELRLLHERLAKALAGTSARTHSPQPKLLGGDERTSCRSIGSDSTNAPENGANSREDYEAQLDLDLETLLSEAVDSYPDPLCEEMPMPCFAKAAEKSETPPIMPKPSEPMQVTMIQAHASGLVIDNGGEFQVQDACTKQLMTHCQVPRPQNLADTYNFHKNAPPTTMMIRNLPGRYTQSDLVKDLHDLGFSGTFDFLYVPVDSGTEASVGYAFVNFINPGWAMQCQQVFTNYRFRNQKRKLAHVSVAHLQGLEANMKHYKDKAIAQVCDKSRRPVVWANLFESML